MVRAIRGGNGAIHVGYVRDIENKIHIYIYNVSIASMIIINKWMNASHSITSGSSAMQFAGGRSIDAALFRQMPRLHGAFTMHLIRVVSVKPGTHKHMKIGR